LTRPQTLDQGAGRDQDAAAPDDEPEEDGASEDEDPVDEPEDGEADDGEPDDDSDEDDEVEAVSVLEAVFVAEVRLSVL